MSTPTARPENEALLPVEQADRDAAARFRPYIGETAAGLHDGSPLVQAFAAHRLASTPTALPGAEDVALREVQCSICGGHTFTAIDVRQFNGTYAPGPERRCVECKTTFTAQAFAALPGETGSIGAARIIDPDAWHETLPADGCGAYWSGRRNVALAKADRILALIPRASDEVPANPVGEGLDFEGLGDALFALSGRLKASGFLDDTANRPAYERVVAEFQKLSPALAGKSADAASSQEQGASGEVAK